MNFGGTLVSETLVGSSSEVIELVCLNEELIDASKIECKEESKSVTTTQIFSLEKTESGSGLSLEPKVSVNDPFFTRR